MANLVSIDVQATDHATAAVDAARASLMSLPDVTATDIEVHGAAAADAEISLVRDDLSELGRETATPDIELKGAATAVAEAGAADEAIKELGNSSKSTGASAGGLGASLGGLATPMGALIGAGVALSPVLLTVGTGLGGLGIAAYSTISPILAAASATGGLKANMDTLSPVQQQMAQQLLGLQSEASAFSKSLQPEVVSIWGAALGLAGGVLKDIQPVAAATGAALSGVVNSISADLKTAQWQSFFAWMTQQAGPDVQQLGTLFIDLMNTLPPLLKDLQPLAQGLLQVADGAAQLVQAAANLPSELGKAQQAVNGLTQSVGSHIPEGNKNIFQVISDGVNWISNHVPDGNKTLLQLASGTDKVTASSNAAGQAMQTEISPAQQLAAALGTAATSTTALDTAWNLLVGNFNSEQQAITAAKTAVQSYASAVQQGGADSLTAQSAFYAAVQSVQQMTDAEAKNHAPAAQMYADIESQIKALQSKGPLNAAEKQDLANLQKAADGLATSTQGLTAQQKALAGVAEDSLLPSLKSLHTAGTTLNTDMTGLAASIANTGSQSSATASARAKLIADLEASGVQASTAKTDVDRFQGSISSLTGKTVKIGADTSAGVAAVQSFSQMVASLGNKTIQVTANVSVSGSQLAIGMLNGTGFASGGIIGAAGGGPRSDLVMVGEQGPELVRLPAGSTVNSNPDSQRMMAMGGGGGDLHITLELGDSFKRAGLSAEQLEDLRYTIRQKGGRGSGAVDRALAQN